MLYKTDCSVLTKQNLSQFLGQGYQPSIEKKKKNNKINKKAYKIINKHCTI